MKRKLSVTEGVEAAIILRDLNSGRDNILALAEQAGLDPEKAQLLLDEWRAFVHAAVLYGLMNHAPNVVVVTYLRSTRDILTKEGYGPEQAEQFVDGAFQAYTAPLLAGRTKDCPALLLQRLLGKKTTEVPARCLAVLSGTMAMVFASVLDKMEQYDFLADDIP